MQRAWAMPLLFFIYPSIRFPQTWKPDALYVFSHNGKSGKRHGLILCLNFFFAFGGVLYFQKQTRVYLLQQKFLLFLLYNTTCCMTSTSKGFSNLSPRSCLKAWTIISVKAEKEENDSKYNFDVMEKIQPRREYFDDNKTGLKKRPKAKKKKGKLLCDRS